MAVPPAPQRTAPRTAGRPLAPPGRAGLVLPRFTAAIYPSIPSGARPCLL